jgi:hypothetical protein
MVVEMEGGEQMDFDIVEITNELGAARHAITLPGHIVRVECTTGADSKVVAECGDCEWWNEVLL